jgi:hypothetical protein
MAAIQTQPPLTELEQKLLEALVDHFEPCGGCGAQPSYAQATRDVMAAIGPEIEIQALERWAQEFRQARGNRPQAITADDLDRRARTLRRELEATRAPA